MANINQILHISSSGMLAQLTDLDLVSDNLANINTAGFKSTRSNFQELLNAQLESGVEIQSSQRFMDQGNLQKTDSPLDLAINGEGFFAVQMNGGQTAYTRDGEFSLDSQRRIVNANGLPLVWQGQIPQDATEITVKSDGTVLARQGNKWNQAGVIQLNRFANPSGMEGFGSNLWLATDVSGQAQTGRADSQGFGEIVGSSLEQSNVNIANEMAEMVSLQRSFQMSLRALQQTDQMIAQAIRMRRG
jgi:flagellar basal-body rod protein FlgG